jgi:hypothetical protein
MSCAFGDRKGQALVAVMAFCAILVNAVLRDMMVWGGVSDSIYQDAIF